nr:uncharacterized protein LOC123764477 [Procambarus clarkii]XP_045608298.1 uncharacterized protein LOC123764477 [Procambarus clarkii]XP_045608299.1 uncharacterized protein LOC123764477 [Procambarus clarkii]
MQAPVVVVVVVVALLDLGSSGASQDTYTTSHPEGEPGRRLCGWRLANKLNRVCKGVYNNPRSTNNYLYYRGRRVDERRTPEQPANELLDVLPDELVDMRGPRLRLPQPTVPGPPYVSRGPAYVSRDPAYVSRGPPYVSRGPHPPPPPGEQDSGAQRAFLTLKEAAQMLKTQPRHKRGLSAECCQKVCTVSELVGYCY